jgi:hypothetical protein
MPDVDAAIAEVDVAAQERLADRGARCVGSPLQDCIEAMKAGFLNDPTLVDRGAEAMASSGRIGPRCVRR